MDYCVRSRSSGGNNNNNNGGGNNNGQSSTPSTSTSGSFRLKIYWEQGYDWQDEYVERFWCLTHSMSGTCWAGLDRQSCKYNAVYVTRCGNRNQNFQYQYVGNEVMIKVSGQDKCLTRSGIHIDLRSCNSGNNMQKFYAPRGDLNGYRFELSQKSAPRYCLNQDHHPKNAEYVQMFPCSWTRARNSLTSYWEKY